MRLPDFSFHQPITLDQTFSIMENNNGNLRIIAGGTDLIPLMKYGLETPSTVVSIKNIEGLKDITQGETAVTIGAMISLADIISSPIVSETFPALHEAAIAVAAPPLWNVATLGGNILQNTRCLYYNQSPTWRLEKKPCFKAGGEVCHAVPRGRKCFSVYCGDIAPALIVLNASLLFQDITGPTEIRCIDLFSGNGLAPFTIGKNTVLTGIKIPIPKPHALSSYVKLRIRSSIDYPLVSTAASIALGKDLTITDLKLVLSAIGPAPAAIDFNDVLVGRKIDEADFSVLNEILPKKTQIVDNLALPGSYRRKMLSVISKRAIMKAVNSRIGKETT